MSSTAATPGHRRGLGRVTSGTVVIGLFIWARIGDQRQRSFVMGDPGSVGFQDHEYIPGRMPWQDASG
jgi:hypothetical protein